MDVAHDLTAAMDAIARQRPGSVLLDLSLADEWGNNISALAELSEAPWPLPVLAMRIQGRSTTGSRFRGLEGRASCKGRCLPPRSWITWWGFSRGPADA